MSYTESRYNSLAFDAGEAPIPHGVEPITWKDGKTTYQFKGQEYESLDQVPANTWGWLNKVGEKVGETVSKIPGIEKVTPALQKFGELTELPGEEFVADQVGQSAQQYGVPYNVGKTLGYALYPGFGEAKGLKNIPPTKGLTPAYATSTVGRYNSVAFDSGNNVKVSNVFASKMQAPTQLTNIVKSGKDVATELSKSPNYKALNKKYQYIKPEEFANSPNLKKFLHREQVLGDSLRQVKKWEDAREIAKKIPKDKRGRLLKSTEKNVKTSRRTSLEHASLNLLDKDAKHVFFMNRNELKQSFKEFAGEGVEWHHLFGNKETGNLFLNEIAQDTMITANLMEHMKKLKLQSSGVRKNLSIMRKDPHNELHTMYRKMGFEQGKELDFADYMQEIAKSVGKGETDVNEFFTMLDVYAERTMPWLKKKTKSFGGTEMSELPIDSVVDKYQSTLQKQLEKLSK